MRFLSSGESHGKAISAIIDGFPSGISIDFEFLNEELKRRQKGFGRGKRMDIEKDKIEILSGIRFGRTLGTPISFLIYNNDWESWNEKLSIMPLDENNISKDNKILNPRPGHADFPGYVKYRFDDIRNVIERSSARETAARVAVGGFAKIFLKTFNINIYSIVNKIGKTGIELKSIQNVLNENLFLSAEKSDVRCPEPNIADKMKEEINNASKEGNTLGGSFILYAKGLLPGLGSYIQWDKRLDAKISHAIMSIPAIKAVEIGQGINASNSSGLDFHDEIFYSKEKGFYRNTNNAGGIEGGITNGEDIIITAYMKPIPTTFSGLKTVNIKTKNTETSLKERSDVCAVPSASIVGEAMLAIALADEIQKKFGEDNIFEILENYNNFKAYIKNI
ncbi:MAG: chorismate synthase [Candidatus Humimicrobiaceae bacterium]